MKVQKKKESTKQNSEKKELHEKKRQCRIYIEDHG